MKKTALSILFSAAAICAASAQTVGDAFLLSENNYEGTARTIALGNAVTALGGDLGAVTINPAASAVARYSQITITPGLRMTTSTAQGIPPWENNSDLPYFQNKMRSSRTAFSLPNLGFTFNWDTGRQRGVKNMSFGFIANVTNSWNEDVYAKGTNDMTSYLGAMAFGAGGFSPEQLMDENAFNNGVPWNAAIGYYTGMINHIGNNGYIGATEVWYDDDSIEVPGTLNQSFGMLKSGSKSDYIFNFGMNISDFVYLGASLGITSASYSYSQYIKEEAVDYRDFENIMIDDKGNELVSYFDNMTYKSAYSLSSSGVYGKLGVIVTPVAGLRIGAAVQTPAVNNVKEWFRESGEIKLAGPDGGNYNESSPDGENAYTLISPFRANLGLAYTFGSLGLISADYEICNYGSMSYRSASYSDRDYLADLNNDIRRTYGTAQMLRLGAEVKPIQALAIRAGYGLATAPEAKEIAATLPLLYEQNISFGLGYSSKGSFFIDLAARCSFVNDLAVKLYDDYYGSFDNNGNFVPDDRISPSIRIHRMPWKFAMTLGWRF